LTKNQFNIQLGRCRGNPEALKRFLIRNTSSPAIRARLSGEASKTTLQQMTMRVKKELSAKYGW
jgi:hypothetical protein